MKKRAGFMVNRKLYDSGAWGAYKMGEFEGIMKEFNPIVMETQKEYERSKHLIGAIIDGEFKTEKIQFDLRCKHRFLYIISDPWDGHQQSYLPQYLLRNNVYRILTRYRGPTDKYYPVFADKLVTYPWSVPEEAINKQIEWHGDKKVYLTGMVHGGAAYTSRLAIARLDEVEYLPRDRVTRAATHQEYYEMLRGRDAFVVAGSFSDRFESIFAKYFEVAASGCVLFAEEKPDLRRYGFSEDNCIPFDGVDDFREKASRYYAKGSEAYLPMRRRAVEFIRSRHTVRHRMATLRSLIEEK